MAQSEPGTGQASWTERTILDFIKTSPLNTLGPGLPEPAWEEALVGFSRGDDPLYQEAKDFVGAFHFSPLEIFSLTFPEIRTGAEDLTVISWVLPQREATKADNRREKSFPSERWLRARFPGEGFNQVLRRHLVKILAENGIPAVAPVLSPHWSILQDTPFGYASKWSERHVAHISGLGTFGLCDGLITPKGKAHRVGSVVARIKIEPTPRPYRDHRAYCLYFADGGCRACAKRCPVGAIDETGHNKIICREYLRGPVNRYAKGLLGEDWYGCGLCQTKVPCESGIPVKPTKIT